ncbi:MAG: class I SAM-dependent methyltransferase [Candidatus Omnitrophica bacterium]|nr:class I SAM-dependent methyltransferase [Candidatus Omnitrophota bacterium]
MDWDRYWSKARGAQPRGLYEIIAEVYRHQIISRSASAMLSRYFPDRDTGHYLHAGCGSGGSDGRLRLERPQFHLLDISPVALELSRERPSRLKRAFICGDLFSLPFKPETMDGVFNFGVMEHFAHEQIDRILFEFHRVLKPRGRLILFWPPAFGLSVMVLSSFLAVVNAVRTRPLELYPEEISRIPSFPWVRGLMTRNAFKVLRLAFGPSDLFTYVAVIAEKA